MLCRKLKRWALLMSGFECDSALVCAAFTCLNYCGKIRFRVTHIFREGNVCADKLANLGFIHGESFHWYNRLPSSMFL